MTAPTPLSFDDFIALRYLECGSSTATHHVARTLGFDRGAATNATARARTLLRRLERWGLVAGVRSQSLCSPVRWWEITDAGRAALV